MTTKLRHPQVASLRTINSNTNFEVKNFNLPKRKSAVQMLQETKAFYVKSETVLDKKQEFKSVMATFGNYSLTEKKQKIDQKDNELQDKLRILLDFDSIDSSYPIKSEGTLNFPNRKTYDPSTCFQHKSLPDLLVSSPYSSDESSNSSFNNKFDGDSRSVYSTLARSERFKILDEKSESCRYCVKTTNNCKNFLCRTHSKWFASLHIRKKGSIVNSKTTTEIESSYKRRSSNTSSCNRSRHNSSSKHSQSADSGRQSQGGSVGLRTGRSGLPEFSSSSPKSSWSDSGTEDDFSPPFRNGSVDPIRKRPILRSKSDISHKYCINKAKPVSTLLAFRPSLTTSDKLETFFDHLGMDPADYKELASNNSGNTSPVYFSSVSSADSCMDVAVWRVPEPFKAAECPSIVERNARIIKWLYNCRKFQKTIFCDRKPSKNATTTLMPSDKK